MKTILDTIFLLFKILTEPMVLFILFMGLFFFLKRKRKKRAAAVCIGLVMFTIIMTGNGILGKITAQYLQTNDTFNAKCNTPAVIVVLGGGVTVWNGVAQPHITSYSRLVAACKLYHSIRQNKQPCKILLSGNGNNNDHKTSEAVLFRNNLIAMGIPDFDIIKEDKSRNTYENAKFSKVILQNLKPSQIYLVTSGFHLKRALLLFKTVGITAVPCPSDLLNTPITVFPNSYNSAMTSLMLRELIGIGQIQLYNYWGLNK